MGDQIGQGVGYVAEQAGHLVAGTISNALHLPEQLSDTANEAGKLVTYQAEEASKLIDNNVATEAAVRAAAVAAATIAVRSLAGLAVGATIPASSVIVATAILIGA